MHASENSTTKNVSDVCLYPQYGGGFFQGVCAFSSKTAHFCDPPPSRDSRIEKDTRKRVTLLRLRCPTNYRMCIHGSTPIPRSAASEVTLTNVTPYPLSDASLQCLLET
jgi:hypothetical protein